MSKHKFASTKSQNSTSPISSFPITWKLFVISCMLISLTAIAFAAFIPDKKIAYVETASLMEKYEGMVDVRKEFDKKVQVWQGNIDTLAKEYEQNIKAYEATKVSLNTKVKQEKEKELGQMRTRFLSYRETLNQKVQEEDAKGTEAVVNQVNDFLRKYGKLHGYDMIYGASGQGNILYAHEGYNITEEVLQAMNDAYNGR